MNEPSSPTFADLGLHPAVVAALADIGYEAPSPIQAQTIPLLLEGADPGDQTVVNGMPGFRVSGSGSSDAIPVQFVALALSGASGKPPVLVLAYASQEAFAAHASVFETLIKSLKRR